MPENVPDPKPEPLDAIPPGWISKPEALALTGRSLKRFEQTITANAVQTQYLKTKGKRPTPIYPRAAIESLIKRPALTLRMAEPGEVTVSNLTRPRSAPGTAVSRVHPHQALTLRDNARQLPEAPPPAPPAVSIDRKHLITQEEAHALGYPLPLLRAWKAEAAPPGIRYGRRAFRFSVPALADRMRHLGTK